MKILNMLPVELPTKTPREMKPVEKGPESAEIRDLQILRKSNELEAVFLTQLIKSMEKTVPDGMNGGKNSLSTMMFSSVLGDAMSQGGGIGLSKMIYASLKKMDGPVDLQEMGGENYLQTLDVLQNLSSIGDKK